MATASGTENFKPPIASVQPIVDFHSMTPDVSCYDSPAEIFKGVDHPTTAQANGTEQCSDGLGGFGICQCNVANGDCVASGIGTIFRNSMYTLHSEQTGVGM